MLSAARRVLKRIVFAVLNARDKRGVRGYSLAPELWSLGYASDGGLEWDGVEIASLAERFGTPLHVVSRSRLERDYRAFRDALESTYPRVDVSYSYKTNPLPGVIKQLHALGASAEVISHFELWLALRLGMPPGQIIFNGPAKSPEALRLAVDKGIKLINIDSLSELEALERITAHAVRKQRVGVRLVTSVGWSAQFGMKIADGTAREAFRRLSKASGLHPCAVHVHLGNGLRETAPYAKATAEVIEFVKAIEAELGVRIEHLDLGGGFGVPTVRPLSELDQRLLVNGYRAKPPDPARAPTPAEYAREITGRIRSGLRRPDSQLPELILEPGRALTSRAQLLLLRVVALKSGDRGGPYAILDGGKNLAIPTGYEYHEVLAANPSASAEPTQYSIFGPLCHTGDLLFRYRTLPTLEIGSLVVIMDAGAYFVPNQMNFSNPRPAAVMVDDGSAFVLREPETFEDVVRLDGIGTGEPALADPIGSGSGSPTRVSRAEGLST